MSRHKVSEPRSRRDQRFLCMHESAPQYNFIRPFYCSLPKGHSGEHIAYWAHDPDYEEVGASQPAWEGPWQ